MSKTKITQSDRAAAWHYIKWHCLPDCQMTARYWEGYYDDMDLGAPIRAFAEYRRMHETRTEFIGFRKGYDEGWHSAKAGEGYMPTAKYREWMNDRQTSAPAES